MKKKILDIGLFMVVALASAMFYGCGKDEDEDEEQSTLEITATNVLLASGDVATVKFLVYNSTTGETDYSLAETTYIDSGFTLELPSSVPSVCLRTIDINNNESEGISISNENVKAVGGTTIPAYNSDGERIGLFYYMGVDDTISSQAIVYEVSWIYVNSKVEIKGQIVQYLNGITRIENYDINLNKGWNIIYLAIEYKYDFTTGETTFIISESNTEPSCTMAWTYVDEYVASSSSVTSLKKETWLPSGILSCGKFGLK